MIMVLMTAVCHCKYLLLLLHLLTLSIKVCFVNSGNFFLFSYRISGFFAASIRLNISSLVSWMRIILANWSKCVRVCVRDLLYSALIDSCLNCVHRLQVFPDHQWVCEVTCGCVFAVPRVLQHFHQAGNGRNMSLQAPQSTAVTEINTAWHTNTHTHAHKHTHSGEHLNCSTDIKMSTGEVVKQ